MTFKNQFIEHEPIAEAQAWLDEEIAEQTERFKAIEKSMQDLAPVRAEWYSEFFDRISTLGFNTDGDQKVVIATDQLPVQPEGNEDQVVWKYGVDEE